MALFGRRKPAFQLTGLLASPDGLYDGSFIVECASWWNYSIESQRDLARAGYRPLSGEEVKRLCAVPQPENRLVFETVASSQSLPGRHSAAVLSLAYGFAVVIEAIAGQVDEDFPDQAWVQARPHTAGDLTELERHYSQEGALREFEEWMPYWQLARTLVAERVAAKTIGSLRATFDDQVDRWSSAEGFDLRQSIGTPDYAMIAHDESGLPNFVELLFEWGGRLRLGERLIAEGLDLRDLRFGHDEFNTIDHLYVEARARYFDRASQPKPLTGEVEWAANACADLAGGDGRSEQEQMLIFTTTVRAYLWRTVEDGAVHFMEPELSQAVERSRTVGERRRPDERFGLTLFYAATQCMQEGVKTRLGSLGGLFQGPRSYERAFWDTTSSLEENRLDEETMRLAFQLGVCLADAERVLVGGADQNTAAGFPIT